ncbi:hypothetical protein RvVAT039_34950 [Agrobacterium vitis]|nr:hypothetical protein RvVAT039_34950 [Agrobacterium vitis]
MKRVKNEDIQYPEMRRRTLKTCVIELKTHIRADQCRLITLDNDQAAVWRRLSIPTDIKKFSFSWV